MTDSVRTVQSQNRVDSVPLTSVPPSLFLASTAVPAVRVAFAVLVVMVICVDFETISNVSPSRNVLTIV